MLHASHARVAWTYRKDNSVIKLLDVRPEKSHQTLPSGNPPLWRLDVHELAKSSDELTSNVLSEVDANLRYLWKCVIDDIVRQAGVPADNFEHIKWCFTVPGQWSDKERYEAMLKFRAAGFEDCCILNVLEAAAAAVLNVREESDLKV
jgi:hypothetical protein